MKYILLLLLPAFSFGQADTLGVFQWKPDLDVGIITAGLVFNAYYIIEEPNQPRLYTQQIFSLHREEIPSWEISATYKWNESYATVSDYIQGAALISPLILLTSSEVRNDALLIGWMAFETMMINQGITGILKLHTDRKRPFVYNPNAPIGLKYRRQALYSFPSAHTSASAANLFFAAKVFSEYFPHSKWKKWIWGGAVAFPLIVGILRYESGSHYISDIAAGFALGAGVGYLIPYLHKSGHQKLQYGLFSDGETTGLKLRYNFSP